MKATAFVVGPVDGPGAAMTDMARGLKFQAVLPYAGVSNAEQQAVRTPVCFFLFAAVADVETLRNVAEAIRFAPSRKIRFSPLIYFSESPSVETIKRCINMGFDDVVTMPFSQRRLADRMARQVGTNLVYYETSGYFGPDRRDRAPQLAAKAQDERVGGKYRRLEIVRNFLTGINVVRDDLFQAG
ncbi:hypothetical protein [Devosia sp.]|uniref:hypothetical protein n=1 Tax=Devosia sp. TaxID=1871048 RepID=UPI003266D931